MSLGNQNISRRALVSCGLWPANDKRDPALDEDAAGDLRIWCESRFNVQLRLIYLPSCPPTRRAQIEPQLTCPIKDGTCVIILNNQDVLTAARSFLSAICLAAIALHEMSGSQPRIEIKLA